MIVVTPVFRVPDIVNETDEPVLEPPKRLELELKKLNLKSDFFRSPKPGEILQLTK